MAEEEELVVWRDPPEPRGSGGPRIVRVAAALRARPGEWGIIASYRPPSMNLWWDQLGPSFEVEVVRTDDLFLGNRDVYARYTAGLEDEPEDKKG